MLDAAAINSWQSLADRVRVYIGRRLPREKVDDVLQDVLLRIHKNARHLRDESRFGPWVYSIARNAVIDQIRRRPLAAAEPMSIESEPSDRGADESPLLDCVSPFVARLPATYRHAITLVELQGMTQAEAAAVVGISLSGMKSRVQRGRELMRAMFEECCKLTIDGRGRVIDAEQRDSQVCTDPCGQ